jgi:hypothetical protein
MKLGSHYSYLFLFLTQFEIKPILQARAFDKLSNEYLFVRNGVVNLLEIKFENPIWNSFELIRKGGKLNKSESDRIYSSWAQFRPNPNGPARYRFAWGGKRNKNDADRWGRDVSSLNYPESVS